MRWFDWLFPRRHSHLKLEEQDFVYQLAEYCQLPSGEWVIKRELTLPSSTERLFLTMPLSKRRNAREVDQALYCLVWQVLYGVRLGCTSINGGCHASHRIFGLD